MARGEFLDWCARAGMGSDEGIARIFQVTRQTVANWRRAPRRAVSRRFVLCALGVTAWSKGPFARLRPVFPRATARWLRAWASSRGLRTLAEVGAVFGVTRQNASKWMRGRAPGWLPLACLGADYAGLVKWAK